MNTAEMKTQIPEGYKDSPYGLIPIDWKVESVGQAFDICNNLRFPISEDVRKSMSGEFPYYGPTKVQDYINEYRVEGKYALIGEDGDHFLKWKELSMTLLVDGKFNVNNHAHLIKGNGKTLTEWFYYFFSHRPLTPFLTRQGAGRYKLTKDSLSKIPCVFPEKYEQNIIAKLLSTWDKAIEKTTLLIAQKEKRKKWLMQVLLTGKKRLKGFEGEWKEVRINEVSEEICVKNKNNKEIIVLSCTKYDGLVPSLEYFGRKIYSDDLSTYKIVPKNSFAYATNHIEEGSIGYQSQFEEGLISPMYTVFKTSNVVNDGFLFRLLKSHSYIHEYQKRMEGSIDRRGGLRWEAFGKIKLRLPSIEEQMSIELFLETIDREINLLKAKLDHLKYQKKGLMQVLLTGRKRLKTR